MHTYIINYICLMSYLLESHVVWNVDSSMRDKTAVLNLKQLNTSISSVYCNDPVCLQQTGGNYTYTIPLSPRFPKLPVTMQFM